MRNKAEIALYALGGATLLGAFGTWLARRKTYPGKIYPQLFILSGGLLATGGALSIHRAVSTPRTFTGALGLAEISTVRRGDRTQRLWYDDKMGLQERVHLLQGLVAKSVHDPDSMRLARAITGYGTRTFQVGRETVTVKGAGCKARDDMCELRAIFDWTSDPRNLRYTGDVGPHVLTPGGEPEAVDFFATLRRAVEMRGEDCLPEGTLLLTDDFQLVPIEGLQAGTKIWGRDAWTTVERAWYKGVRSTDLIQLNNGSSFRATGAHKVYIATCPKHPRRNKHGKFCSCSMERRDVERIRVRDLEDHMVLASPTKLPFGTECQDPDRALIEGLYIADGWSSHNSRFDIAGRDGHPKEAQKKLIEEVCTRLGVRTTWHDKHISILDPEWAARVKLMGSSAPVKRALSINLDEGAAAALLRGLMADSDRRDNVFTTTSRALALQVRLLHKMFGIACGEMYLVNHGGLGKNPIWRLYPRMSERSSKRLIRVKAIERGVAEESVYDLTTSDHYVYLPEADVTVSNCDGHYVVNSTLAILNGFTAKKRITSNTGASWDHIYAIVGLPKMNPTKFVALDTTLGQNKFGKEPKRAKYVDYAA